MTVRPVDQPFAWVGHDRILLNDVTVTGLHRWVIARKDEMMDMVEYIAQGMRQSKGAEVSWWCFERDGYWFLWIVWKEQ